MHACVFSREDNLVGLIADTLDDLDRDILEDELATNLELEVLD